jgi:hypothetical protein
MIVSALDPPPATTSSEIHGPVRLNFDIEFSVPIAFIFHSTNDATMKFALTTAMGLLLADQAAAFAPFTPVSQKYNTRSASSGFMAMAVDMPAAQNTEVPVIQKSSYGPTDVRYSDFLRLVTADKIEKVTFSSDGTQLLGVDVDGTRVKIEALPNDPDLLTQLTQHKVCFIHQVYSHSRLNF